MTKPKNTANVEGKGNAPAAAPDKGKGKRTISAAHRKAINAGRKRNAAGRKAVQEMLESGGKNPLFKTSVWKVADTDTLEKIEQAVRATRKERAEAELAELQERMDALKTVVGPAEAAPAE